MKQASLEVVESYKFKVVVSNPYFAFRNFLAKGPQELGFFGGGGRKSDHGGGVKRYFIFLEGVIFEGEGVGDLKNFLLFST